MYIYTHTYTYMYSYTCVCISNFSEETRLCFYSTLLFQTLCRFPLSMYIYLGFFSLQCQFVYLESLTDVFSFFLYFFFTSGIGSGGILPSAACHRHLFYLRTSFRSVSIAPVLLSASLCLLALQGAPLEKQRKLKNARTSGRGRGSPSTFPYFLCVTPPRSSSLFFVSVSALSTNFHLPSLKGGRKASSTSSPEGRNIKNAN